MKDNLEVLFTGSWEPKDIKISVDTNMYEYPEPIKTKAQQIRQKRLIETEKSGKKIWDATTYRLKDFSIENGNLNLELQFVKYSTRYSSKFLREYLLENERIQACGLYVTTLLETSDKHFIFAELTGKTSADFNFDSIGGVLSHDEQPVNSSKDIFSMLYTEILEETGIKMTAITKTYLFGAIKKSLYEVGLRGLLFYTHLSLSKKEVEQQFSSNEEVKNLIILSREEMFDFIKNNPGNFTKHADYIKKLI